MEPGEKVWEGRIAGTPLRVGVHHAERIIAEWDTPQGPRHKIASSLEEFERSVLFQLLLAGGESEATPEAQEAMSAVAHAQIERPKPQGDPNARRRKGPKARRHRRSRRPPRRR